MEGITNRTPQQEQELNTLKEQLVQLERQQQKGANSNLPFIIGGAIVITPLFIFIGWFVWRRIKVATGTNYDFFRCKICRKKIRKEHETEKSLCFWCKR